MDLRCSIARVSPCGLGSRGTGHFNKYMNPLINQSCSLDDTDFEVVFKESAQRIFHSCKKTNKLPSSSSHSRSSEVPSSLVERVLVVKSQLHSVFGVTSFVSEDSPGNKEAVFTTQQPLWIPMALLQTCSLTVAPESLRLGFYILEVDVKILPRGGSGTGKSTEQWQSHHRVILILTVVSSGW